MLLSTTPNINITKLFCELHSMLLLLPMAAILDILVASEQRKGKLCHSISIQSTYFVRQLSLENVRVLIFVSVMPLYSSGGPFNMATILFSFPKIDSQSSPIFEISWPTRMKHEPVNAVLLLAPPFCREQPGREVRLSSAPTTLVLRL